MGNRLKVVSFTSNGSKLRRYFIELTCPPLPVIQFRVIILQLIMLLVIMFRVITQSVIMTLVIVLWVIVTGEKIKNVMWPTTVTSDSLQNM